MRHSPLLGKQPRKNVDTGRGFIIHFAESGRRRARVTVANLGSAAGGGDLLNPVLPAQSMSPPMTILIVPVWLALRSSFSPYFLGASFEAYHFRASICNLAL